MKSALERL